MKFQVLFVLRRIRFFVVVVFFLLLKILPPFS